jgi:hypothetical protein
MKTVIIAGVPRTGKSRLANRLYESTKSTVFHADSLTNCLKNNYPQVFQMNWQLNGLPQDDPTEKVLVKLIRNMGKEFNYIRIFDTSVLTTKTAAKHLFSPNHIILFLGYPNVEPTQKLQQIRDFAQLDPNCWSNQYSDEQMLQFLHHFKLVSQQIQDDCLCYNLPFFDTSFDVPTVLNQAFLHVINHLSLRDEFVGKDSGYESLS